jgi:acyl-coenzyme A thioesterase PaaI-like protein
VTFRHLPDCYGCGPGNPAAIGIVVSTTESGAEGRVHFGPEHQGPPGCVHGGLLALLLDETMGTVPHDGRGIRVTAEMTVRFRAPTPIGTDLLCRAGVGETTARGFTVVASIVSASAIETVLVEGRATYVVLG